MSRKLPFFTMGNYYHIYNRGAHKQSIFQESSNYLYVIGQLKQYSLALNIAIIAYCLMPNHYHFLVRQDGHSKAGLIAQRVFNSYTKAYNKKYEHRGTLFEGPYKAKHVNSEPYLHHLYRYIHLNPVKDGLVTSLEDWPYSNYLDWIGQRHGSLIDRSFINDFYSDAYTYKQAITDYLDDQNTKIHLTYLNDF